MSEIIKQQVGIVVPTLGEREEFLYKTLLSIKLAGDAYVILIHPKSFLVPKEILALCDNNVVENSPGLPLAINQGMASLPEECIYVNWLGDDDLLAPNSLSKSRLILETNLSASFIFGNCQYIDEKDHNLGINKLGKLALFLIKFGPDLIPQPGALIRRSSYIQVGGVSSEYKYAFDQDLFLKLLKVGEAIHLNTLVSSFRWHSDSLSVSQRRNAVQEASDIRVRNFGKLGRVLGIFSEPLVRFATLHSAALINFKAKSLKQIN